MAAILTVADIGQPSTPSALADFGDLWEIERGIGRITSDDRGRQRQAKRIEYGHGDLHLFSDWSKSSIFRNTSLK